MRKRTDDRRTQRGSCVYDWKETSLYDSDLPTVEVRRLSPIDFHIGGESAKQTRPFAKWLEDKLAALRAGSIEVSQ